MIDKDLCLFRISELEIYYNGLMVSTNQAGDDLTYAPGMHMNVELHGVKSDTWSHRKVGLELYADGCDTPLCTTEDELHEDEISWDIHERYLKQPGKYHIRMLHAEPTEGDIQQHFEEWKGAYRYSFFLMKDGEELEHPELKRVCLSADLKLMLEWDRVQTELDRYDVICYNGDWELMGKAERLRFGSARIKTRLSSPFLWTDGAYFMVVLHNGAPFLRIGFDWKDGSSGAFAWEHVDGLSPDAILVKDLRKDASWQKWQAVPGASEVRKALARNAVRHAFNQIRKRYDLPECWAKGQHCALMVEDGAYDWEMLYSFSKIVNPSSNFEEKDCSEVLEHRNDAMGISSVRDLMEGWKDSVLCLHHLPAMMASGGNLLLNAIEERMRTKRDCVLMLVGTPSEVRQVMEASAVIGKLIQAKDIYRTQAYTLAEQVHWVQRFLSKKKFTLSEEAGRKMMEGLRERSDWRKEQLAEWLDKEVFPHFVHRVLLSDKKEEKLMKEMLATIEASDIRFPKTDVERDEFSVSMEELDGMVGLKELKTRMAALFNRKRFEAKRHSLGLPIQERGGCHMIFTGNPGTGKTTVARMVGRVFHSLGLLSKGGVITTERSKLVGRYLGDTENNVQALLEQAKGNVLFIDEAYSLFTGAKDDRRDFGHRVIESLLTVLSQKNPDLVVILSGYEKEMMEMLETNPGMKGRFPYHFRFDDYNAEELVQIARNLTQGAGYVMTPDAEKCLKEMVGEAVVNKDAFFHNARWVEQCIQEGVVSALADRVMSQSDLTESRNLFTTIEAQDIEKGFQLMKPQAGKPAGERRRIGFIH